MQGYFRLMPYANVVRRSVRQSRAGRSSSAHTWDPALPSLSARCGRLDYPSFATVMHRVA